MSPEDRAPPAYVFVGRLRRTTTAALVAVVSGFAVPFDVTQIE